MSSMNKMFIDVGYKQAELFKLVPPAVYIDCLVKSTSQRNLLYEAYKALVAEKLIPAVETLPAEQKQKLWDEAKHYAGGRLDQQSGIRFLKALIALNYFT